MKQKIEIDYNEIGSLDTTLLQNQLRFKSNKAKTCQESLKKNIPPRRGYIISEHSKERITERAKWADPIDNLIRRDRKNFLVLFEPKKQTYSFYSHALRVTYIISMQGVLVTVISGILPDHKIAWKHSTNIIIEKEREKEKLKKTFLRRRSKMKMTKEKPL